MGISRGTSRFCSCCFIRSLLFSDAIEKQTRFVDQHKLNYKILSDANGAARKAYQVSKAALGLIDGEYFLGKDEQSVTCPHRTSHVLYRQGRDRQGRMR